MKLNEKVIVKGVFRVNEFVNPVGIFLVGRKLSHSSTLKEALFNYEFSFLPLLFN